MNRTYPRRRTVASLPLAAILLVACGGGGSTDADGLDRYRLTTEFLGPDRALSAGRTADDESVIGFDALDDELDQEWILSPLDDGFHRIANRASGSEPSLDVINDGVFDRVTLAASDDVSGQRWLITPLENGYCRLTTEFLGAEIALDVAPETLTPTMRAVDDVTGQHWQLTQLGTGGGPLDGTCRGADAR